MKEVSEQLCIRMKNDLNLFRYLDEQDLKELPCFFELMELAEGETLWREGDPGDFVAFIIAGRLEIRKETEFKGKNVILGIYSRGSIVGEMCVLDTVPRAVTAVALEDTTLITLSRENFNKLIEEHPAVGVKVLKGMLLTASIRLKKSFERIAGSF